MALEIPIVADVPDFDFQVDLDGATYTIALAWNERDAAWYLTLQTAEEETILASRKVVIDLPLWSRFKDPRLPPGVLLAIDTTGAGLDAGLDDLGRRVQLLYYSATEIPVT